MSNKQLIIVEQNTFHQWQSSKKQHLKNDKRHRNQENLIVWIIFYLNVHVDWIFFSRQVCLSTKPLLCTLKREDLTIYANTI